MKIVRVRFFIVVFWAIMTGWLIRFEAFPQWFTCGFSGYSALFEGRPFILDSWMQITFNDAPIGYSHTWVDSDMESRSESLTIRNKTALNLNMLGESQAIGVFSITTLDDRYIMQSFSTTLNAKSYKSHIAGRRLENDSFEVIISTPMGEKHFTLTLPDDCMLYSPATEMAMRRLKPGDSLRLRVLDPISMSVSEVTTRALRREKLAHDGRNLDTTVLK